MSKTTKSFDYILEKYRSLVDEILDENTKNTLYGLHNVDDYGCVIEIEKIFHSHKSQILFSHLVRKFISTGRNYCFEEDVFWNDMCNFIKIEEIKTCIISKDKSKRLPFRYYLVFRKILETTCSDLTYFTITALFVKLTINNVDEEYQINLLFSSMEKVLRECNFLKKYNKDTNSTFLMFDNLIKNLLGNFSEREKNLLKIISDMNNEFDNFPEKISIMDEKSKIITDKVDISEKMLLIERNLNLKRMNKKMVVEDKSKENVVGYGVEVKDNDEKKERGKKEGKNTGFLEALGLNIAPSNIFVKENKQSRGDDLIVKNEKNEKNESETTDLENIYIRGTENLIIEKRKKLQQVCNRCIEQRKHISGITSNLKYCKELLEDKRKEVNSLMEENTALNYEITNLGKKIADLLKVIKTNKEIYTLFDNCVVEMKGLKQKKKKMAVIIEVLRKELICLEEKMIKKLYKIDDERAVFERFINNLPLIKTQIFSPIRINKCLEKEFKIVCGFERLCERFNVDRGSNLFFDIEKIKFKRETRDNVRVLNIHHEDYTILFLKKMLKNTNNELLLKYSDMLPYINIKYTKCLTKLEIYALVKYMYSTNLKRPTIGWFLCMTSGLNKNGLNKVRNINDILFYKQVAPEYKYSEIEIKKMKEEWDKLTPQEIRKKYKKAFIKIDRCSTAQTTMYTQTRVNFNNELQQKHISSLEKFDNNFVNYVRNEEIYLNTIKGKAIRNMDLLEDILNDQTILYENNPVQECWSYTNDHDNEMDEDYDDIIGDLKTIKVLLTDDFLNLIKENEKILEANDGGSILDNIIMKYISLKEEEKFSNKNSSIFDEKTKTVEVKIDEVVKTIEDEDSFMKKIRESRRMKEALAKQSSADNGGNNKK